MEALISKLANNLNEIPDYNKKYDRVSRIHKYWARKPWHIVEKHIKEYSNDGDTVFDPFTGSGSTGLEALLNGRKFIGSDINPMSLLISYGTLNNDINKELLVSDFNKVMEKSEPLIQDLYKTDKQCEKCENSLIIKEVAIGPKFTNEYPSKLYCPTCSDHRNIKTNITSKYYNLQYPEIKTLNKMKKWTPNKDFPEDFYKDRFSYKGVKKVDDLYTTRNLAALSFLLDSIYSVSSQYEHLLLLAFTNTVLHSSKLKGINVRPLGVNNYWIPDDYIEENVWFRYKDRFKNVLTAKDTIKERMNTQDISSSEINFQLFQQSATEFKLEEKVDYIFTDPPYGEAIQYSELSYVWNAWIDKSFEIDDEVIINPMQDKGEDEFYDLLKDSLKNIYDNLKNDKYFTLCFQNKSSDIWKNVIDSCKEIGFTLHDINIYDNFGNTFNNGWAKYSPKADIYVTFKKSEVNKELFFSESFTLEYMIEKIINYSNENNLSLNYTKLYDLIISLLIWNLYYNESFENIDNFTIKDIQKVMDKLLDIAE